MRPTTALLHALAWALVTEPGWSPRRAEIEAEQARLAALAGDSVVPSTPGGERRRRRRLRKARLAANAAALPALRAKMAAYDPFGLRAAEALVAQAERLLAGAARGDAR